MLVAYAAAKRGPPVGRIRTAAEALPAPNRQPNSRQPNSRQPNSPSRPGEIRRRSRWPPVGAHPVKPKRCAGGLPRMRWPYGNARLPSNHSGAPRCASHQTRRSAAPKRGTSLRKLRRRSRVSRLAHALAQRRFTEDRQNPLAPFARPAAGGLPPLRAAARLSSATVPRAGAGHHSRMTAALVRREGLQVFTPSSSALMRDSCPFRARPGRPRGAPSALAPPRFTHPYEAPGDPQQSH